MEERRENFPTFSIFGFFLLFFLCSCIVAPPIYRTPVEEREAWLGSQDTFGVLLTVTLLGVLVPVVMFMTSESDEDGWCALRAYFSGLAMTVGATSALRWYVSFPQPPRNICENRRTLKQCDRLVKEGSVPGLFPCRASAVSACSMTFLTVTLGKTVVGGAPHRALLAVTPMLGAFLVAAARVAEKLQTAADVAAGVSLGIMIAGLTYRMLV